MAEHRFQMSAAWEGGRNGVGTINGKELRTAISVPGEMDGPGVGTNPEELLIAAAMNCYIITLAAILEKRGFGVKSLTLQSEGTVSVEGGSLSFKQIIHRPHLVLEGAEQESLVKAEQATHRAEQACMVSKALRGNVAISVEPVIETV